MKPHFSPLKSHLSLFTVYLSLFTAHLSAQTAEPYAWDASTHPPQTARLQVWRGDTVPLAPSWGASDTNGWSFVAYWSTNNAAWWSKGLDGAHSVTGDPFLWTPDMDCGAKRYRLFVQAYNAGGASFRANADVSMLDSPGVTPAVLPAPDSYPALAVELMPYLLSYLATNTPAATDWQAVSNIVADAVRPLSALTNVNVHASEYEPGKYRLYSVQ